ncbi:MAG: hypothetical protein FWD60_07780 [Candidatus Azobacteroides sp.]|nr:hypothetical protein [Candidatus Azobacteroides sp.]
MNILYIGIAQKSNPAIATFSKSLLRSLRILHHTVYIYGDKLFCEYFVNQEIISSDNITKKDWDIVIIQNSLCFLLYQLIMKYLRKFPIIFVSCIDDNTGYIAPFDNLYAVLSVGEADLTHWSIPVELNKAMKVPVKISGNYYRYEEQPDYYELVYFPVKNSTSKIDSKILNLINYNNCRLTVIGGEYKVLKPAINSKIRIVSDKQSLSAFKKAHLVMASGYQAIQAITLCKPCVIVGDHGLGGRITTENYELFKKYGFRGRAGASSDEFIPFDLLCAEIKQALSTSYENDMISLRDLVIADGYSYHCFHRNISRIIDHVRKLYLYLHDKNLSKSLKPCLSSIFSIQKMNNKSIIKCGQILFDEVDEDMLALLRQCNGKQTIEDIMIKNGYDLDNVPIFTHSILELWKKKIIVFNPF